MVMLYLMGCLPLVVGAVLWGMKKEVIWWEWLAGAIMGFVVAGIMNLVAVTGMTGDHETWSGRITHATHHPEWVEKYKVAIYKTEHYTDTESYTDGNGKRKTRTVRKSRQVFSHYETRYRTHSQSWDCQDTLGNGRSIPQSFYEEIKANFGGAETRAGNKSGFYSGDPNVYVATNKTGYIYPTTTWRSFENRIKAAPSLFSFSKVPEGTEVFPYPENANWRQSNRLLGSAATTASILEWDRMNARLGPSKKVNVIACGFGPDADSKIAHYQQASWVGGRKNDVVICFGGGTAAKPSWVFVFGWTESELAKRNLESIILENGFGDSVIPLIEKEIEANYVIKDWKKFDYISIEAPTWVYVVNLILIVLASGGYWFWAMTNEADKEGREQEWMYGNRPPL